MLTTMCKHSVRHTQITIMRITENQHTTPLNSQFTGPVFSRLIIGMVNTTSLSGSFT